MLKLWNTTFHFLHIALILFVLVGWIPEPLRVALLILCGLILLSWFGIGLIIRKPGFCLITEIQYRIRKKLGIQMAPQGYMVYLGEKMTGRAISETRMEVVTQVVFYLVTALSAYVVFR